MMKVGMLGTGIVGRTLAAKLAANGHDVVVGTRDVDALMARTEGGLAGTPFSAWIAEQPSIRVAPFAEAASGAEIVFNATEGSASLDALALAGTSNLAGTILIDTANPLDFSHGMPPTLTVANTDSLAEQIQRAFPEAKVVKTLNTVTAMLMVDPGLVAGGDHDMFVAGNDADAKASVVALLTTEFGWRRIIDLGDLTGARPMEMYLPLWIRMFMQFGSPLINVKVQGPGN